MKKNFHANLWQNAKRQLIETIDCEELTKCGEDKNDVPLVILVSIDC